MPNYFPMGDFGNDLARSAYVPIALVAIVGNLGAAIYGDQHVDSWCSDATNYVTAVVVIGAIIGSLNVFLLVIDTLTYFEMVCRNKWSDKCCDPSVFLRYSNRIIVLMSIPLSLAFAIVGFLLRPTLHNSAVCSKTPDLLTYLDVVSWGTLITFIIAAVCSCLLGFLIGKDACSCRCEQGCKLKWCCRRQLTCSCEQTDSLA